MRTIGDTNRFWAEIVEEDQKAIQIYCSSDGTHERMAIADSVTNAELIVDALNLPPRLKRDEVFGLAGKIAASVATGGLGGLGSDSIGSISRLITDLSVAIQTEVDSRFHGGAHVEKND